MGARDPTRSQAHPLLDGGMLAFHLTLFHSRVDHQLVQLLGGRQECQGPLPCDPGQAPPLPQAHLGGQLLHVGVQLLEEAVALAKEAVLGVHKGQHRIQNLKFLLGLQDVDLEHIV